MNGRIYDPILGRMLQADPFIQAPSDTQSYNRYSYVQNNPLRYTDPSGYNWKDWVGPVIAVVGTVVCYGNPQCGATAYAAIGATSGGASAAVNGGNFVQGAIIGGISGAAFYGVATADFSAFAGAASVARAFSYGVVGGVASVASGGKMSHGFISAGAGGLIPGVGGSFEQVALRTIGRAIIGGTVSEITGGKFANGAATAAFASIIAEGVAAANDASYVDGNDWQSGYELPEGYYNDKVAMGWSDPLPQGLVDVTAGFGDTFGAGYIRSALGIDGGINYDSGYYMGGQVVGAITPGPGTAATLRGAAYLGKSVRWLNTGKNWRIGPGVISKAAGAKPFNYGAGRNIPMLRIGNKTPSSLNHFDLRVLGK